MLAHWSGRQNLNRVVSSVQLSYVALRVKTLAYMHYVVNPALH